MEFYNVKIMKVSLIVLCGCLASRLFYSRESSTSLAEDPRIALLAAAGSLRRITCRDTSSSESTSVTPSETKTSLKTT